MIFSLFCMCRLFDDNYELTIVDVGGCDRREPKRKLEGSLAPILSVIGCQLASSIIALILVMEENSALAIERSIGIFFVFFQGYPPSVRALTTIVAGCCISLPSSKQ